MRLKLNDNGAAKRPEEWNSQDLDRKRTDSEPPEISKEVTDESQQGQVHHIIGHFGSYQLLIFIFKILIGITSAFNNLGVTFYAPTKFVGYWCADADASQTQLAAASPAAWSVAAQSGLPPSFNLSLLTQQPQFTNASSHSSVLQMTGGLPEVQGYFGILSQFVHNDERTNRHRSVGFNYDTPKSLREQCNYFSKVDNKSHGCTSYDYDTGIWIKTIIDEWNLVCDRSWLISFSQSLYMGGFIIAFPLFGYISDRFGRWNSLMIGALIEMSCGFGCAYSNSIITFLFFRFLVGLGNAGRTTSSYLIMIEWVGPKWRMHISTLGSLGWVIGYCTMPWITLFFLHFRHMQLFACFWELIFIILLLRIPESPRWLLTHRKFDKAYDVLLMAAKFNGLIKKQKPQVSSIEMVDSNGIKQVRQKGRFDTEAIEAEGNDKILKPYTIDDFNKKFEKLVSTIDGKEFTKNEDKLNIFDLFRWKNLRTYLLILSFVWASNSFIYYGIALRVGDFGGSNIFVSFTIAGLTEFPSMFFTIVCMKYLPRRTTNIIIFSVTGLLCGVQIPLKYYDMQWLQQTTIMLAKLANSCAFTCILYQTMELFPTSIRQTAYSSCSLAGRIGSILAPFVKELAQITNDSVPPVIYSLLSLLTCLLITLLPETKGADLHDTLLEAEKFKGTKARSRLNSRSSAS